MEMLNDKQMKELKEWNAKKRRNQTKLSKISSLLNSLFYFGTGVPLVILFLVLATIPLFVVSQIVMVGFLGIGIILTMGGVFAGAVTTIIGTIVLVAIEFILIAVPLAIPFVSFWLTLVVKEENEYHKMVVMKTEESLRKEK